MQPPSRDGMEAFWEWHFVSLCFFSLLDVTRQGSFVGDGILAMNGCLLPDKIRHVGLAMLV